MSKNIDVVDLFDEEISKKDKKIEKKVEKARLKELKKEEKKKKKLEKEEENGFEEYLQNLKDKGLEEAKEVDPFIPDVPVPIKKKNIQINDYTRKITPIEKVPEIKRLEKHPILDFFITLFSILLLVISSDYLIYNIYTKYVDFKTMVMSIVLVVNVVFYLLSIMIRKEGIKKFFQILSLLLFCSYMGYYLFMA